MELKTFKEYIRYMRLKSEERRSYLNEYIYPDDFEHSFDNFLAINNIDEDSVTECQIDWYIYNICDKETYLNPCSDYCYCPNVNNYINEMLNKTSIELLKKELNRGLNSDSKHFITDLQGKDDHSYVLLLSEEIYDVMKIAKICDKMMWGFTSVKTISGWRNPFEELEPAVNKEFGVNVIEIKVEPIKTKNITDFVKNDCGGVIYHICHKDNVNKIMKSGLRLKGEDNEYRWIKNKIFFVCGKSKNDILENIKIVAKSKEMWDNINGCLKNDYSILEINVKEYNIDFYMDGFYENDVKYIGYCYTYIPPKMIKEIEFEDMERGLN